MHSIFASLSRLGIMLRRQRILARSRITIECILVQDHEPIGADLDGGGMVLSVRAGAYFGFNATANEIWQMLAEPRRVEQIIASLSEGHDVDTQTIARDVTLFLQTLLNDRLVRVIGPQKGS
jgi:Coenzyme PQQ synthesis protein D (PqqD)